MDDAIAELLQWVESGTPEELDPSSLAAVDTQILEALRRPDANVLDALGAALTPLAAAARARLGRMGLSPGDLQLAGLPIRAGLVRAARFLEKDDPDALLRRSRHGERVLRILHDADGDLNLVQIAERWPHGEDAPSVSTLSRTAAALEEGALLLRLGATRGRTCRLLPRGRDWIAKREGLLPFKRSSPEVAPAPPPTSAPDPEHRTVTMSSANDFRRQVHG